MIVVAQDVFEWKDEYDIGVEKIDEAHRQLFAVVNRIINNFMDMDFEKNRMTCIEAIKYLKNYTIKHFAEEEEYQLSINYSGYEIHKKLHDNMRDVVIHALEKEVTSQSYSRDSLEHFVGVCAGWLVAHVLIEDQAITGKTKSKWTRSVTDDETGVNTLDGIVKTYVKGLFRMKAELVSRNYAGFPLNKPFCYTDLFTDKKGNTYTVVSVVEESTLEVIAQRFLNLKTFELNAVTTSVLSEMLKSFNMEVMMAFQNDSLTSIESRIMPGSEFYRIYDNVYPDYSMLWRSPNGYIAFTIKKNKS